MKYNISRKNIKETYMENLVQFKEKLVSFSLDELYQEKEKCERALANMMFD